MVVRENIYKDDKKVINNFWIIKENEMKKTQIQHQL